MAYYNKKSQAEIVLLGWEPCQPLHTTIRFGGRTVDVCQSCGGKGYWYCWGEGAGQGLGQCYRKRCPCRGGVQRKIRLDAEYRAALEWFKTTTPPAGSLKIHPWSKAEDAETLWGKLWGDIETGNVYRLEAIRDDIVALYQALALNTEEF